MNDLRGGNGAMKNLRRMLAGFYIFILVFTFFSLGGCERGDYRRGNRGYIRDDNREYNSGERHYYRDGRWYRHDSRGNEVAVATLAIGALVESLAPHHTTIIVEETQYYRDDRYYYRPAPNGGYVVVSAPVQYRRNYNTQGARGGRHSDRNWDENH